MTLVDSSVWIDHLRRTDAGLVALLDARKVLVHPFVVGAIALGHLRHRERVLSGLAELPEAVIATDLEVLRLIERHRLHGLGIGYVDAHLIASARLTPAARLWTRDRRLREAAARADVLADFT
jgi:predicted nucleic acid-binding protein